MLYHSTIDPNTLGLLKRLQQLPVLQDTRLVGGTALALQMGHRTSVDLNLFGQITCGTEQIRDSISSIATLIPLTESTNIHIYMIDDVKVDIVNYKYPWIDSMLTNEGIRMASAKDIAAMKVTAIVGRGRKKDFADIACLLRHFSLNEILDFYKSKYHDGSIFLALKSLAYFDDAEKSPMLEMLNGQSWEDIKSVVQEALCNYTPY
ncbi:MAG: nucleotidyl transferase AbiEii/AbiGii toxin family protein [Mediterranea sp.]|jgi:hypothetical protein|nr:nucleotidyl transferase AbiEii/AbiGii toxin family protein [Mediterranea sp.]